MPEPDWLIWARELAAIAQTGLSYDPPLYDRERYLRLRELAAEILASGAAVPLPRVTDLLGGETGYSTPKLDVRGAVFDSSGRLLLVREVADHGRWTLPGGWADVNFTPAENVLREIREESGYGARIRKIAAVWDRTRQGHAPRLFSCAKLFFLCELTGGEPRTSHETSEIHWFAQPDLPLDFLSGERVLPDQLRRLFAHWHEPSLPTDWD